jgi:hypothetical protein
MTRARLIAAQLTVLTLALALSAGMLVLWAGKPPDGYTLTALNAWAPVKEAGPSARLLAEGVARLVGPSQQPPPDWFTAEDRAVLDQAEAALRANHLQEGLGHLMVLSGHLEQRGKTLSDFLPLVAPDLAAWLVAAYFAPLLLGMLVVTATLLIFAPWLVRRLIDTLKMLMGLVVAVGSTAVAVSLCVSLADKPALVFTAIEGLTSAVILTLLGNIALAARNRRRRHRLRLEAQARTQVKALALAASPRQPEVSPPVAVKRLT